MAAENIQIALAEIFGGEPVRSKTKHAVEGDDKEKGLVECILIGLAIPPALVASMDLATRLDVVNKLEKVIEYVEKIKDNVPDFYVNFVIGSVSVSLKKAKPEDLTNSIAEEQRKVKDD
ncbi:hypothetical protein [Maridesulfovibrio sp.]|uniref:hypothetical protein n=1 Tax=Maridesulfovibrio sp. TaxID=2795000 RepID=UPI003BAD2DF1